MVVSRGIFRGIACKGAACGRANAYCLAASNHAQSTTGSEWRLMAMVPIIGFLR